MRLEYRKSGDLFWKEIPIDIVLEAKRRAEKLGHPNRGNPYLYLDPLWAWLQILLGGDGVLIRAA